MLRLLTIVHTGYLPGGGPFESPSLQQGEGREHGQDEEEEVLAEGGGHLGDQEGGQVAELEGGEVEKRTLGNHDRHLHEQHPTPSTQVRDGCRYQNRGIFGKIPNSL